jgi:putative ABC transport system ATP-binding protein
MLKLHDLSKVYRTAEVETIALNAVNVEIAAGEFVAIMGPSGCGKSTLLNIIGMLDTPTSGQYLFYGEDVSGYSESKLGNLRKQHIGFIFQSFNLIDELTVAENIELALLYHDTSASERRERVAAIMDKVGIAHRAKHMPGQLSGGQQQRVAVARAVVGDQALILADEPTGNLDLNTGEEIIVLLKNLSKDRGVTVISATHDIKMLNVSDQVIWIRDGRIDKIEDREELDISVGAVEIR